MSKRSLVPASSRFGFAALAVLGVWFPAACSVYSPDLTDSGALSTAGNDGKSGSANGGSAPNSTGGSSAAGAGASNTEGGGGNGTAGHGGSVSGGSGNGTAGTGASSAGTSAGGTGSGTAGTSGVAGSATGGGGGGGTAGASNLDLIDNLEDNDGQIRLLNNPKRDGIWDSGNDGTSTGTQTPAPGMFKPKALLATEAPYVGDKYAAYSKASGFSQYAFMNVSMRSWPTYDTTYPKYDASGNKGIQFLAKAGAGSSLGVHVRFISGDTDPRGGKCALPAVPTPPDVCYNHYYASVTLSNDWQTYTLNFNDDFFQPVSTANPIDTKEMYGLEFYFGADDDYEIWVDDLYFVKN